MVYSGEIMELHETVANITSKTELAGFVRALRDDLRRAPEEWENGTLDRYLNALAGWIEDCDGYYENQGRPVPTTPTWRDVADMLIAAKMYE
jgi:hypothetical protein